MNNVLIATKNEQIREGIRRGLALEGIILIPTSLTSKAVLSAHRVSRPSAILLDMPPSERADVCRQIRAKDNKVAILVFLDQNVSVYEQIQVLSDGADDCFIGQLGALDVIAKIRAVLRRGSRPLSSLLTYGDLSLNSDSRIAVRGENRIELTPKEYQLLELFMLNPERVMTRDEIGVSVWGEDFFGESNVIEVYVRYLRLKTEFKGEFPRLLHTVRGIGYALRQPSTN